MAKEYLKIPPRPIFIKHGTNKIAILTVHNKIYGLSYDNITDTYYTTELSYDKNYKKAINQFIIQATKNNENYNSKETFKDIANQRTEYIIKELKLVIQNKQSNGHFHKANGLQTATIKEILIENNVKDIDKLFTANINEIETQKALKNKESLDKEKIAKLESLKKEVATKYDNDYAKYITDKMKYLVLNEYHNIMRIVLACLSVITKRKGLFFVFIGGADTGKSYLLETTLEHLIPDECIEYVDDSTIAGFTRQCQDDPYYYDGKIIYLGDLGDKGDYEKAKELLNILKRLVSEKRYKRKLSDKDNKFKTINLEVFGTVGVLYSTVLEDTEDKTGQIGSRGITGTPATNNRNDKIDFQDFIDDKGIPENYYYHKTIEELKNFKLFIRELIKDYKNNNYEVISPFRDVFKRLTKESETEIREYLNLKALHYSYVLLNKERCIEHVKKIGNEEIKYLIPNIKDVQNFINIIYSSIGLKPIDRNLLLKLKKELNCISEDEAIKLYKTYEQDIVDDNPNINSYRLNKEVFKQLFKLYGVNSRTDLNNSNYIEKKIFFTSSNITSKYRNSKAIDDIENMSFKISELCHRGFIGKFETTYNRGANVYYLIDEEINRIKKEYTITNDDIIIAMESFSKFKADPSDPESKSLFNNKELLQIQNNYNINIL